MVQLTSIHDYWENRSLDYTDFVGIVMFLLFNILSCFVIAFLPRSKHLLISRLQSLSTVILEPEKIKSVTASTFLPSISHGVMGLDPIVFVVIQSLSGVWLWPHGPQQARLPCPSLFSGACSISCPLSWWGHPSISSSGVPSIIVFLALTFKPDFSLCSFTLIRWLFSSSILSAVEWRGWWLQPWDVMGSLVPCLSPSRLL